MTSDHTQNWRPATQLVRGGLNRSSHGETCEALYLTSGFVYESAGSAEARFKGEEDGFVYSRYGNPTVEMFQDRLKALEGAEACFATSSGMAAVHAALASQLKAGDRLVASRALFGSCHQIVTNILPRFGIETVLVDGTDLDQWRDALKHGAACIFLETPSNPTLEIIDLPAVIKLAHEAGARVVVDNVFSTPLLQQPIQLGADVSVYSGTKHIDGQGRCLGGAILCSRDFHDDVLLPYVRHTGPALSPYNAWTLLKGLETLDLRVGRQCQSALRIAQFLESHPAITRVLYPGLESHPQHALAKTQMRDFGTVVSFEVAGGKLPAFALLDNLRIVDISNNLGDSKSLITHPATTTHRAMPEEDREKLGITEGFARISAGLEDVEDLLEDLNQALDTALQTGTVKAA
ncbi:MAG: O-succinylhomoserine sulfhydrylase [Alphaproteobacteria bacterium]|jgi:O-succinylhomoserine sulfhydrylase|nr:O-succinylhomoserine sulfhydrylase [Alphaproteobacteria bacterium]